MSMLKSIEKSEKKKKTNKEIKILIETKTSYGIYLLEAKFTLQGGLYKHFNNMLMLPEWLFKLTKCIDSAKKNSQKS